MRADACAGNSEPYNGTVLNKSYVAAPGAQWIRGDPTVDLAYPVKGEGRGAWAEVREASNNDLTRNGGSDMGRTNLISLALALCLLVTFDVQAFSFNSTKVIGHCESVDPKNADGMSMYCLGVIAGVADMLGGHRACFPDGIDINDLAKVYVNWAKSNPHMLHAPAAFGVGAALTSAYPCQ